MGATTKRNIVAALEDIFVKETSIENSIRAARGDVIRIDRDLWEASPVLREHLLTGKDFFTLDLPESSVQDMLLAHRDGNFPQDFGSLLNLTAATDRLGLSELTSRCLSQIVSEVENFTEIDYPAECDPRVAFTFFRILMESPLRTTAPYLGQLARIAEHCKNDPELMSDAVEIVRRRFEQCGELQLGSLPVDFKELRVPVAFVKRDGRFETLIFHDHQWEPVELLGRHCNLQDLEIGNFFYLKYGSYLLYKTGSEVFLKSLRSDVAPRRILDRCSILLTRGKFVFAVVWAENVHSVLQWKDDDHFEQIYSTSSMILCINFDCLSHLIAIQEEWTGFTVRKLGEATPVLTETPAWKVGDVQFLREGMCVEYGKLQETFELKFGRPVSKPKTTYRKPASRRQIVIGDFHFEFAEKALVLRKFPSSLGNASFVTLSGDETPILSELWMTV